MISSPSSQSDYRRGRGWVPRDSADGKSSYFLLGSGLSKVLTFLVVRNRSFCTVSCNRIGGHKCEIIICRMKLSVLNMHARKSSQWAVFYGNFIHSYTSTFILFKSSIVEDMPAKLHRPKPHTNKILLQNYVLWRKLATNRLLSEARSGGPRHILTTDIMRDT